MYREAHVFTNGEEECKCTFILFWLHGPSLGNLSAAGVGSICNLQTDAQVDSDISSFARLAKQRLKIASSELLITFKPHASASGGPAGCEGNHLSYNAKCSSESICQACILEKYLNFCP